MEPIRESFLATRVVDLPAGNVIVPIDNRGQFILVTEATETNFEISFDGTDWIPCWLGFKRRLTDGSIFKGLRFRSTLAQTVTIVTGTGDFDDSRLNMIRGRVNPTMEAESVITDHSATIPAGGEVDLTDLVAHPPPGARYIRKATIIFNMDPAVDLDVANSADEVFAPVFFRQGLNLETSDPVKVQNSSGAPIVARISQLWYVVN